MKHGHHVMDFSMQHPNNLPSEYSKYFVSNVDYHEKKHTFFDKSKAALKFVHNQEAIRNISKLLSIEKPQIAHLHNIYHQITPAVIPVLKKAGVKVILTLHDYKLICPSYYLLCDETMCKACVGKHFYRAALRRCQNGSLSAGVLLAAEAYWHSFFRNYEMVDLFLAPSHFIANIMARYRINKRKIVVLHNGIDTTKYQLSGVDKDYIIYFGRIAKVKGINTLLSAYKGLKSKLPLRIVGAGPYKDKLQTQHPDIEFTGYCSGNKLKQLISEASFSIVPSEWYENCSMSVLESMAYGKPVVGSNIGGIPEQIADGRSGFLFEQGNAADLEKKMIRLIQESKLRRDMGQAGRRIIEKKYSLIEHCNTLTGIYKQLINQ